jgi:hypothetical protein
VTYIPGGKPEVFADAAVLVAQAPCLLTREGQQCSRALHLKVSSSVLSLRACYVMPCMTAAALFQLHPCIPCCGDGPVTDSLLAVGDQESSAPARLHDAADIYTHD